jgi:DNA modification methylase
VSKIKPASGVDMGIVDIACAELHNDPANVRKHGEQNLAAIKGSLARFGQQKPIVVNQDGVVIAGNGTLMAARALGWQTIKAVRTNLAGSEATAFAIADNRTAELAEWDDAALQQQLAAIAIDDEELLAATGFDEKELAKLAAANAPEVTENDVPEPPADPITQPGDLWLLGKHRLLCGDSTKAEDVERLMAGVKADLCFTSPPYGQQRDYTEEGKAKVANWDGLMRGVFGNLPMTESGQVLVNLGLIHREGEWIPYWDGWIQWMREQGWKRFGWYVWDQGFGLPGDWQGRFAPSHEFIFHFNRKAEKPDKTQAKQESSIGLKHGKGMRRKDGTVQQSLSSPEACLSITKIPDSVIRINRHSNMDAFARANHPATFPIALPAFFQKAWPGSIYEPFLGSGTTLIAAEQLGRKCYGMEISPAYCDVIVKRWETLTGQKATREER